MLIMRLLSNNERMNEQEEESKTSVTIPTTCLLQESSTEIYALSGDREPKTKLIRVLTPRT